MDVLEELKVRDYRLQSMLVPEKWNFSTGYGVGPLSQFLPEDLARRYGAPLGLECEPGAWPSMEKRPEEPEAPRSMPEFPAFCGARDDGDPHAALGALLQLKESDLAQASDACDACLPLLKRSKVSEQEIASHAPRLLAIWNSVHAELKSRQQEVVSTEWLYDEEYLLPRGLGGRVLDVLGYVPGDEVVGSLNEAVLLNDPRLKTFAIVSLVRLGETVDPAQLGQAAASMEMRMTLCRLLKRMGKQPLMPEPWAHPIYLAQSDLCGWAAHPNELGVCPDEIELMMRCQIESDKPEPDEVYLFRFREYPKPWEPGEGWMAGIAGPIVDGESQDSPWSSFKRWDSMSPDEHFEKLYYR